MKITCNQIDGLIYFYLNNELSNNLKIAFEEHIKNCPECQKKYKLLSSIITDLKDSYNQILVENNPTVNLYNYSELANDNEDEIVELKELSAYIDNELNDDTSIKMRKNIIAKPFLRKKLENLYNLRKIMNKEFDTQKNKLKNDYSKSIIRELDTSTQNKHAYLHCIAFIILVISIVFISTIVMMNII